MIRIDLRWHNPDRPSNANAMTMQYFRIERQISGRRAGDWLQERLQSRGTGLTAERAVIEFKAKNNSGRRIARSDKQLSDNSNQLGSARAHTADEARLERVTACVRPISKIGRPRQWMKPAFRKL
jgi:hypothetical protein